MAGRGGRRQGAGRKRGSVNKLAAAATKRLAETGMLPHEILARLGRGEQVQGFDIKDEKGKAKTLNIETRIDCLKASARFYAPTLLGAVVKTNPNEANPWAEILSLVDGKSRGLPKPT